MPFLGDSRRFTAYRLVMDDKTHTNDLRLSALEDFVPSIWQRLKDIEKTILDLNRGLELMTIREVEKPIKRSLLEYQVASLAESTEELESRLKTLERQVSLLFTLLRVVGIVLLVFASVYATQFFF